MGFFPVLTIRVTVIEMEVACVFPGVAFAGAVAEEKGEGGEGVEGTFHDEV